MRPSGFLPLTGRSRARLGPLTPLAGATPSSMLNEQGEFGSNPGALRMLVYAPPSLAENAPLVVILHGCGQTAADYAGGSGWIKLADAAGFAVLAPEQTRANNMNTCFNWFQPGDSARGQGEAASISQMIERVVADRRLDRARIFITGLSAGGAMTAAMLASYPEVFAGGAIIAGLPFGSASNVPEAMNAMRRAPERSAREWGDFVQQASFHQGPWPRVSIWQGDSDMIVHASNGEALIAQWASVHGLSLTPSRANKEGGHLHRAWTQRDGTVALEAFHLSGMGHGTPVGGAGQESYGEAGPYFLDAGISSTAHIAAFWGLRPTVRRTQQAAIAQDHPSPSSAPQPIMQKDKGARAAPERGVKAVILAALKSAGLLKD
jgi:poly(hydroxyalkanoate) depolymerase family esterase